MPKRENRLPAEDASVTVLAAAAPDAAAPDAAVPAVVPVPAVAAPDAAAPDAAAHVFVDERVQLPTPAPVVTALPVLSVPAAQDQAQAQAQNELLFKMVVEQQRQQIEALSSMVRELQHRIVAPPPPPLQVSSPPAVSPVVAPPPAPTARAAAARASVGARGGGSSRRRAPRPQASSAFSSTVPQLPHQAALGGGDDPQPVRSRPRGVDVVQGKEASNAGDLDAAYKLRRETRGSSGRRIWDHRTNTPRSQANAGVFAARDEIRTGSSYVVRGFSGMI